MEYQVIPKSELEVSRICYGSWQASGWEKSDDSSFTKCVHRALDAGVNFFDTAESYGKGHAEALLGKTLKHIRHQVVIASKFSFKNSTPEKIRASIEGSLRRLQTDYIDLYQHHWPAKNAPLADIIETLSLLKEEGKLRAIGVSNWMEPEWEEFQDFEKVSSLQPCYNLLWRSVEQTVLPLCRKNNIAILAYSPLAQGILAGRFQDVKTLPPDPRRQNVLLQPNLSPKISEFIGEMRGIALKYNRSLSQIALRWLLDQPGVTAVVVGATGSEQITENIGASGWSLDPSDLNTLSELTISFSEELKPHDTLWGWHPKL